MSELWSSAAGRVLSQEETTRLHGYLDLLLKANEVMNLTRIVYRAQAELAHVADALTLLPHLPPGTNALADIGSGGGVPGLVLACVLPDVRFTLVEGTQKKARFLKETAESLKLKNVNIHPLRAEEAAEYIRDSQNVVTARAVAELAFLVEWSMPLLKAGGYLLAMKGPKLQEEIPAAKRALELCGGGKPEVHACALPGLEGHVIATVKKVRDTPGKYPRAVSMAKGKPL